MIRTTIRLEERLFRELKELAARTGRTVTSLIDESVRDKVRESRSPMRDRKLPKLPTFHGTGALPGIDFDDTSSLMDALEHGVSVEKRR